MIRKYKDQLNEGDIRKLNSLLMLYNDALQHYTSDKTSSKTITEMENLSSSKRLQSEKRVKVRSLKGDDVFENEQNKKQKAEQIKNLKQEVNQLIKEFDSNPDNIKEITESVNRKIASWKELYGISKSSTIKKGYSTSDIANMIEKGKLKECLTDVAHKLYNEKLQNIRFTKEKLAAFRDRWKESKNEGNYVLVNTDKESGKIFSNEQKDILTIFSGILGIGANPDKFQDTNIGQQETLGHKIFSEYNAKLEDLLNFGKAVESRYSGLSQARSR